MAFSDEQREKIRRFLGYAVEPQAIANITARCTVVSSTSPEAEETAKGLLRELGKIEQQIKNARPYAAQTFSAGSSQGTQQYLPGDRLNSLKREAKGYVDELALLLSLTVQRDVFGGGMVRSGGARTYRG